MKGDFTLSEYRELAEFRFQIRRFLHFSETAARQEGLEPQQHQALLAVRASDQAGGPTVGDVASRLLIEHHSAVGLIDRLAGRGLVERSPGAEDRRRVQVRLTPAGAEILRRLSAQHREELRNLGPVLVSSLHSVVQGSIRTLEEHV